MQGESYLVTSRDDSAAGKTQLSLGAKHLELAMAVSVDACGKLSAFAERRSLGTFPLRSASSPNLLGNSH